ARASWPGRRCSTGGGVGPPPPPPPPPRGPPPPRARPARGGGRGTSAAAARRRRERLGAGGKKTLETLPREQWLALIRDAHPGYLSWDQYETNQKLLLANATAHGEDRAAGPAREGSALLQGLAIC